jgi:hypothetical protein
MQGRWRQDDIARMAGWLTRELRHAGILPGDAYVYITTGSRTNGQAWKLGCGADGHDQVPGFPEYLGWTGAEAEGRCRAILDTLQACSAIRKNDEWLARRRADIAVRLTSAAAVKVGA